MFFVSLAYTYIYICFILKRKKEEKMKRDNKVRKEMKRYLLYIPQIFSFSFIRKEKKQKSDKEREGDKFLSTYQKLSFFFLQTKFFLGASFYVSLEETFTERHLAPFFLLEKIFLQDCKLCKEEFLRNSRIIISKGIC